MNNNEQKKSVEKSISKTGKRNWISPKINIWNSENLENFGGAGGDALTQAYVV